VRKSGYPVRCSATWGLSRVFLLAQPGWSFRLQTRARVAKGRASPFLPRLAGFSVCRPVHGSRQGGLVAPPSTKIPLASTLEVYYTHNFTTHTHVSTLHLVSDFLKSAKKNFPTLLNPQTKMRVETACRACRCRASCERPHAPPPLWGPEGGHSRWSPRSRPDAAGLAQVALGREEPWPHAGPGRHHRSPSSRPKGERGGSYRGESRGVPRVMRSQGVACGTFWGVDRGWVVRTACLALLSSFFGSRDEGRRAAVLPEFSAQAKARHRRPAALPISALSPRTSNVRGCCTLFIKAPIAPMFVSIKCLGSSRRV